MHSLVPTSIPFTFEIYESTIHALADRYSCLDVSIIGHSCMGRPIYALTLGYGPVSYMYNAAHHANEWITAVLLTRFAEEMAEEIDTVWHSWVGENEPGNSGHWYNEITLHMVPMVNPDGVDMVAGGKATPGWKANACGVDLNSNYPAGWDLAKSHKYIRGYTAPGPRDYVGPHPLSEPESMAMAAYTQLTDSALTISLHTQGEEIYWRYMDYMPAGAAQLAYLLSQASGYKLEDVPDTSSHAGYRDWFIERFNRPGYTIECGLGESPLPIADFDEIYRCVRPLLMEAIRTFPIISMTKSY